jgi:hypothetical protein
LDPKPTEEEAGLPTISPQLSTGSCVGLGISNDEQQEWYESQKLTFLLVEEEARFQNA